MNQLTANFAGFSILSYVEGGGSRLFSADITECIAVVIVNVLSLNALLGTASTARSMSAGWSGVDMLLVSGKFSAARCYLDVTVGSVLECIKRILIACVITVILFAVSG